MSSKGLPPDGTVADAGPFLRERVKATKTIVKHHFFVAGLSHRIRWTSAQLEQVQRLADEGKSARAIGRQIGRTAQAVYRMTSRHRIALRRVWNWNSHGRRFASKRHFSKSKAQTKTGASRSVHPTGIPMSGVRT